MSNTVWILAYALAGFVLSLQVFHGIVAGETVLFFWKFKRDGAERAYWCWMGAGALLSLVLFLAALKVYLGPLAS